jgi:hypothetical protein
MLPASNTARYADATTQKSIDGKLNLCDRPKLPVRFKTESVVTLRSTSRLSHKYHRLESLEEAKKRYTIKITEKSGASEIFKLENDRP